MSRKLLHIFDGFIPMILSVMVIGVLAACSNDDPAAPYIDPDEDINMSFRISAFSESATRSDLPEEFGTQIENRIDTNDFAILIFDDTDPNRRLLEILYIDGSAAGNARLTTLGFGEYMINVKLDPNKYSTASRFSIVAIANWRSMRESDEEIALVEGVTELNDFYNYTYRLNQDAEEPSDGTTSWIPTDNSLIPMYGLRHCSLAGYSTALYNEANPMDMGTVNLLRSLVKIEIINNSDNPIAEILDISIRNCNTRGYLAPYLDNAEDSRQVTSPYIPTATGEYNPAGFTTAPIKFVKEGNKYIAYVPELDLAEENSLDERKIIDVTVKYELVTEVRHICLAPHDAAGQPYYPSTGLSDEWKALLRNHIYRFTINAITIHANLLTVDVQPYAGVFLDPYYGLDRDENGNIITNRYPDGTYDIIENNTIYRKDTDGHTILKYFSDGTVLCKETIYKDYIHDSSEVDYEYTFEKDKPGGNMIIIREKSLGGSYHTSERDEYLESHDHLIGDRPLFVIDHDGIYYRVTYDASGKPTLHTTDIKGDLIVQANGFQFQENEGMAPYLGTYIVRLADGTLQLRWCTDGSVIPYDFTSESKRSPNFNTSALNILVIANEKFSLPYKHTLTLPDGNAKRVH